MDAVAAALRKAAREGLMPPGASILLAVSGGADSMALLYGAAEAAGGAGWRLAVGHVHHGWRGREADRDMAFVADHSRRLGLPFFSRRRDARGEARQFKLSPEAGARHARYAALAEMARASGSELIATAHQFDDRLESCLLARERRAGLAALAGPRARRADGVVRPLLEVSRAEILQDLENRGLAHRRDVTNGDLRLPRNRVRREIARLRGEHGPAFAELVEEVRRFSGARNILDREFVERVMPAIRRGPESVLADAAYLSSCALPLQRRAIEEVALPFAAPGRPAMTGNEREQILKRLATGRDFRFEAGRRIRFERRGRVLSVRAARRQALARRRGNNSPAGSVMLGAVKESLV